MKTAEEVKTELRAVIAEFFSEVEKLMDEGQDFRLAVMNICKQRPDLTQKENSLRGHLRALGSIEKSLSASDLHAFFEGRSGALSCAAVTKLGSAVKRLPIAQLGVRYKGKQRIEITRPMLAQVVANFRKRDTGQVPIDYDHSIETAAGSGAPVPAAGWIKSIDDSPDADGVLWGDVEWTPRAAEMIKTGEYKFVSPVLDPNVRNSKTGEEQGWTLTSAALTNQPVLQGMPALVLSATGRIGEGGQMQSNEWDQISVEINTRVKQVVAAKGLEYGQAMQALMLDDRDLWRRYEAARRRRLSHGEVACAIGSTLAPLVQAKVAASEGKMEYGAALRAVLSERPDLERR